jgi:hypothetical protein
MITIYQIQATSQQVDDFNAGQSVPLIEAKRNLMFGSKGFNPSMLQYFTEVATVDTDDLEEAFELTNLWNDPSKVNRKTRMSSTSVGDIFAMNGRYYMVDNFGFEELRLFNDEIEMIGEAA